MNLTRRRTRILGASGLSAAFLVAVAVLAGAGAAAQLAAPANTTQPTITGTPTVGSTLTATQGIWTGDPTSFSLQWVRCPASGGLPDGSDCAAIGGATTQAYIVASADASSTIRVRVTASNADGSTTAVSNATAVIQAQSQAPARVTDPTITGTARVGSTLTATQGQWTNNPTSFGFQWVRCPASGGDPTGSDCPAIGGATGQAYTLTTADQGRRMRVRVTATNSSGSATSASNPTALVEAQSNVPARVADPRITGTARVGSTLVATQGQWSNNPTSFRFQWVRCPTSGGNPLGSDCAAIGGATSQAYVLAAADQGRRIRVRVTASNATGSGTSASNATAVIQAAPPVPVPTGCPAGNDAIRPEQISPPARLNIDRQSIAPSIVTSQTRALTVRFHVSACGGRPVQGMLVYVTAVPYSQFTVPPEATTGADGWAQLTMNRDRFFPASSRQQLLVMFVRARKNGEPVLGGISTRRLVSFPVSLSR